MKYTLTLESDDPSALQAIRLAQMPSTARVQVGDVLEERLGWRGAAEYRWKEIEQLQQENRRLQAEVESFQQQTHRAIPARKDKVNQ